MDLFCTAGLLKVPGLMPPRCKMFDTPGVPHAHQLSSRLDPEEVSSLRATQGLSVSGHVVFG